VPEPVPLAVTAEIHGVVVLAVHGHAPADIVIAEVVVVPAAAIVALVAGKLAAHPFPWFTVNVCPPSVIVPLRASPGFAAKLNEALPEPVPLVVTTVIHGVVVLAAHGHNAFDIVIAALDEPAPAPTVVLLLGNVDPQPLACVIVKLDPPALIVALLDGPVFAV
jgi:hypothetical protein